MKSLITILLFIPFIGYSQIEYNRTIKVPKYPEDTLVATIEYHKPGYGIREARGFKRIIYMGKDTAYAFYDENWTYIPSRLIGFKKEGRRYKTKTQ